MAAAKQLLVCTSPIAEDNAFPDVKARLKKRGIHFYRITTLMTGLWPSLTGEDVEVLHVEPEKEKNIFDLVDDLRGHLGPNMQNKVSPNHILVPALDDHSCPFGPPGQTVRATLLEPEEIQRTVVIIDSGYQWIDDWVSNPLGDMTPIRSDYVSDPQGLGRVFGRGWRSSWGDVLDHDDTGTLDALAGHANFIAGVIRQGSPHAAIKILNHNGGFQYGSDDLSTELSVVRSLCRCRDLHADVINLGFAFEAYRDTISCAWKIAFREIAGSSSGNDPVVVAPAGNQNSPKRHYPAALRDVANQQFANMVGVGSTTEVDDDRIPEKFRGPFSNHGKWVTCSAMGANVDSIFLAIPDPMRCEDGDDELVDFSGGWARWNGTSFATPKVVVEIVNAIADQGLEPVQAWEWLRENDGVDDPGNKLGHMFTF